MSDLLALLDRILDDTLTVLGRDSGAVVLFDEASGQPVTVSARGLSSRTVEAVTRQSGHGEPTEIGLPVVQLVASGHLLGMLIVGPHESRLDSRERTVVYAVADLLTDVIVRWREAEQARLHAETDRARLAGVLAALPIAVYTVDGAARVSAVNPAACYLVQRPASALLGRPCRDAFPIRDGAGRFLCDWACPRTRQRGAPVAGDVRAFLADPRGGSRAVSWSCAPLRTEDGKLLGWVEVVRDVSQLQSVEAAGQALLAAVSHELLSPIAIIKGHAETLQDPAMRAIPELADSALRAIDEEAERLRRLVANLLDAAQAASGTLIIERVPLALGPLLERIVDRFRGRSRRHQFVLSLPGPLPLVLGDRQRLESVLYNLLDNAVKYSPQGGQVLVRAVIHAQEVEVVVEDEGVGIHREDQARIFEPYYRAAPDRRPPVAGSGLGLYLCRTIIDAHGGRIWVESRPGRGAAFHFTVPRAGPAELPATRTPDPGAGS